MVQEIMGEGNTLNDTRRSVYLITDPAADESPCMAFQMGPASGENRWAIGQPAADRPGRRKCFPGWVVPLDERARLEVCIKKATAG